MTCWGITKTARHTRIHPSKTETTQSPLDRILPSCHPYLRGGFPSLSHLSTRAKSPPEWPPNNFIGETEHLAPSLLYCPGDIQCHWHWNWPLDLETPARDSATSRCSWMGHIDPAAALCKSAQASCIFVCIRVDLVVRQPCEVVSKAVNARCAYDDIVLRRGGRHWRGWIVRVEGWRVETRIPKQMYRTRWLHSRSLNSLCSSRRVLLYVGCRWRRYTSYVEGRLHVGDGASTRGRARVRGDDLGIRAATTRMLTIRRLISP